MVKKMDLQIRKPQESKLSNNGPFLESQTFGRAPLTREPSRTFVQIQQTQNALYIPNV